MDITFKLEDFDGPLDLLLHLVKKSNINIYNVNIVDIANQYLYYIGQMEKLNLDIASEYLIMASELIEIKARSLIPNEDENEEEEEDPRENLIRRLIDYNQYKEVTETFKNLELSRREVHTKEPSTNNFTKIQELDENIDINSLVEAFNNFLKNKELEKPLQTKITKKEYSVSKRNIEIKNILKRDKKVLFSDLFEIYSKDYVVVTFLSILDLAKKSELIIKQDENFDSIYLESKV